MQRCSGSLFVIIIFKTARGEEGNGELKTLKKVRSRESRKG